MSDAPQISSVTVGGFTLAGFLSSATFGGAFATSLFLPTDAVPATPLTGQQYINEVYGYQVADWFDFGANTPAYLYDSPATGGQSGPQVLTGAGSATDHWGLTVTCFGFTTNAAATPDPVADTIFNGASVGASPLKAGNPAAIAAGLIAFNSFTAGGFGASSLVNALRSLKVDIGGVSNFAIDFHLSDDTTGGATDWTVFLNACFTAGTRIATPEGEIPVEALRIGDRVSTLGGAARKVKWIGRRAYSAAEVAANRHLRPVLVRRGALGPGRPHRDLAVSALHGLHVDGVMVAAGALVNGDTILRGAAAGPVSYFHVELAGHDIILAEGAPAETFIDDDSRLMFDNADEFHALYGAEPPVPARLPRLEEGPLLDAIRRRLAPPGRRANSGMLLGHVESRDGGVLRGWAVDGAGPVALEVIADGVIVARAIANRYRVDLDHAGIGGGIGGFTSTLPASASLARLHVRRAADGATLPLPDTVACAG